MAVTAISDSSEVAARYGIAFWVMAWGLASTAAFGLTLWLYPACNRTAEMPLIAAQRRPNQGPRLSEMRSMSLSKGGGPPAAGDVVGTEGQVKAFDQD